VPGSGNAAAEGARHDSRPLNLHAFERLIADLSARFVNLPPAQTDTAISDALRQIVVLLDVDRCQLIRFSPTFDTWEVTHSWAAAGVAAVPPKRISDAFPWVSQRLKRGQAVIVPRVNDLPPEAALDKASYQRAGARSSLVVPFQVAGRVEGAFALGCLLRERDWPAGLVERIGVIATVFGNALAHKGAREALDAAIDFERMVSSALAALAVAARPDEDAVIEASLREMARVFVVERAKLWQRIGDSREFVATHRWVADGTAGPAIPLGDSVVPWITEQIIGGAVVRFGQHVDPSAAAATDLKVLQGLGVRAGIIVPLTIGGAVVGAMAFARERADSEWPDVLLQRARLVGDVFGTMLARQAAERGEHEAQQQAAHAARVGTMGAFAASLVHELTQPLAASLANAESASELLAARSPDLTELRSTVADIVADDRRAGELIQQLRRFLRRGQAERRAFELREVVDEALRLAGNEVTDKRITVALDVSATMPKVVGDRVQIQQVLLNLLLNAFEAVAQNAPEMRRVAVLANSSGSDVSVEVTDTGSGMDEPTLARVFEPFFTTKSGGMGLGLSISRTIVSAHGGTICVRSAPSQGTTFRVELPTRPPDDAPTKKTGPTKARQGGTVFVVDDDASMRRALERQLQHAGYRVEVFASAQEFLDRAPWVGVACMVSDIRMPGLSGLDLQASLANAKRDLPIVFISGHADVPTTVDAMKAGAVNFLAKPFTKGDLLAAVNEALARSAEFERTRKADAELSARYQRLTPREREVFALVSAGLMNKLIADRLGAAEATVKIHRGRVMEKMNAGSVADLVRMAALLGLQVKQVPAAGPGSPPAVESI
jgi:FixJ family two-component response regulator/signal transduction histidine kinase